MSTNDEEWTIQQVAAFCCVGPATINNWLRYASSATSLASANRRRSEDRRLYIC